MQAGGGGTRAARGLGLAVALLLLVGAAPASADMSTPTITTFASASVPVGGSLTDTAVLVHGSPAPTGTITFSLYGAGDTACAAAPVFKQDVPFGLPAVSPAYTPTKAGVFTWVASYGGDANNTAVAGACGEPAETVSVTAVTPTIVATASPSVGLGGTVSDTAVLAGGFKPGGTITFRLYGPADTTCTAAPVFTTPTPVATPTVSTIFRPATVGTYHWIATYNGDAANNPVSTHCGDPTAAVTVGIASGQAPPPAACDAAGMARALVTSLVAILTGGSNTAFKASCSAGVRIVLRAKEIRPGNKGYPRRDGLTTIANTLTHTTLAGAVAFSFNAQGTALRSYASSKGKSLTVFATVHVRPDRTLTSTEALQVFSLG